MMEFLPQEHSIQNKEELIQIPQTSSQQGFLASLDVKSFFTNVPIKTTIEIILQKTYHQEAKPPQGFLENL